MNDTRGKYRQEYLAAVGRHWLALMVGIIAGVIGGVQMFTDRSFIEVSVGQYIVNGGFVVAVGALIVAQYRAWRGVRTEQDGLLAERTRAQSVSQRAKAERSRLDSVRNGLARHIEHLGLRMHIIKEVATGRRLERPDLTAPAPTGNPDMDRMQQTLYQVRVQARAEEPPIWDSGSIAAVHEARDFINKLLGYAYVTRFDFPTDEEPIQQPSFQTPAEMVKRWKQLAIRQERMLRFLEEQPK